VDKDASAVIVRRHATELRTRGVTRLDLFGSAARGDGDDSSDIDILVDIAPGRKFSLIDLAGLRAYLSDLLCRATGGAKVVPVPFEEAGRLRGLDTAGNHDRHTASRAWRALDLKTAAMRFGESCHQRQPKSRAFMATIDGTIRLAERR